MITDLKAYGSSMFFIKDHLGSVRAVVSETGEVLQTNEFYPYGDLFGTSGTADNSSGNRYRYRFTGKELGNETGLYDFSARYLQSSLGRFTTIDPLAEKYPSISPYAYCNGNTVNFVDPDGRAIGTVTGLILGAFFGGISARNNGEKVLKGIVSGAVSGVITGLAADLIAASGGSLALVLGGAVASGTLGGMYGEILGSLAVGDVPATSDVIEAGQDGAVSGAISGYLGVGAKMIQDAAKAPIKGAISTADDIKQSLPNASDEVVSEILEKTNQAQNKAQVKAESTKNRFETFANTIQHLCTTYEEDDK